MERKGEAWYNIYVGQKGTAVNGSKLAMDGTPAQVFTHVEELLAMGLSIPQVTQVFLRLQHMGVNVQNVYTLEQAADALLRLKEEQAHA